MKMIFLNRRGRRGRREKKKKVYKLNSIPIFPVPSPVGQASCLSSPIAPTMSYLGDHINATPGGST
ncbi:MAG: hypothetical protein WBV73_08750 [Phormidium sp.]